MNKVQIYEGLLRNVCLKLDPLSAQDVDQLLNGVRALSCIRVLLTF